MHGLEPRLGFEAFLTGFLLENGAAQFGRPAGLAVAKDGALLLSDDSNGVIALNSLTANLRMDLRDEYPNIHVSLIQPGPVATEFHNNALGGTPGGRGMALQSVEDVVHVIEAVIDDPAPDVYTSPASLQLVQRYYQDVPAFEAELLTRVEG